MATGVNGWGNFTGRFIRNMAVSTVMGWGINYFFPGWKVAGVARDIFQNMATRNYDPTTCIGRYNICFDSCIPGSWGTSALCVAGCSLSYSICKWLEG